MKLQDPLPSHQKIAVLGLGVTGLGACRLLNHFGKTVIASDSRSDIKTDNLPENIEVHLGSLQFEDVSAAVLSPSLNPEWPQNRENPQLKRLYERWQNGSIEIWSEVELAIEAFPGKVLTIGGTDGKSTTAALAAHLLNAQKIPTLLGGNSWVPFSTVILEAELNVFRHAVVEVSAFQLWEPHRLKPNVALLTNIAPDHLDHYDDEAAYINAKKHVFRNLTYQTPVVLYAADPRLSAWSKELKSRNIQTFGYSIAPTSTGSWSGTSYGKKDIQITGAFASTLTNIEWNLPGDHNQKNLLGALTATSLLTKTPWKTSQKVNAALLNFNGLPHRIAYVRTLNDIRYYNDSKATNVHAALAGIQAFNTKIVAIIGGVEKNLDFTPLIEELLQKARAVVLIGELRSRITREINNRIFVQNAENMKEAVILATKLAQKKDAIVLSPASSSYDMFHGFEERGEIFTREVLNLTK